MSESESDADVSHEDVSELSEDETRPEEEVEVEAAEGGPTSEEGKVKEEEEEEGEGEETIEKEKEKEEEEEEEGGEMEPAAEHLKESTEEHEDKPAPRLFKCITVSTPAGMRPLIQDLLDARNHAILDWQSFHPDVAQHVLRPLVIASFEKHACSLFGLAHGVHGELPSLCIWDPATGAMHDSYPLDTKDDAVRLLSTSDKRAHGGGIAVSRTHIAYAARHGEQPYACIDIVSLRSPKSRPRTVALLASDPSSAAGVSLAIRDDVVICVTNYEKANLEPPRIFTIPISGEMRQATGHPLRMPTGCTAMTATAFFARESLVLLYAARRYENFTHASMMLATLTGSCKETTVEVEASADGVDEFFVRKAFKSEHVVYGNAKNLQNPQPGQAVLHRANGKVYYHVSSDGSSILVEDCSGDGLGTETVHLYSLKQQPPQCLLSARPVLTKAFFTPSNDVIIYWPPGMR